MVNDFAIESDFRSGTTLWRVLTIHLSGNLQDSPLHVDCPLDRMQNQSQWELFTAESPTPLAVCSSSDNYVRLTRTP